MFSNAFILTTSLNTFIQWDKALFVKINSEWINPFFDYIMPILREPKTWIPLYVALIGYMFYKYGWKALPWVLMAALAPTYGDIISSHGLKDWIGRIRPCNDITLGPVRNIIHHCGGNGSFTSSHATNHFALAAFFYFTLKPLRFKWLWVFFIWAGLISYAQVYVGVHFPGDVLAGAILGTIIGYILAWVYNKKITPLVF